MNVLYRIIGMKAKRKVCKYTQLHGAPALNTKTIADVLLLIAACIHIFIQNIDTSNYQ